MLCEGAMTHDCAATRYSNAMRAVVCRKVSCGLRYRASEPLER
jgi:hypothetical protein